MEEVRGNKHHRSASVLEWSWHDARSGASAVPSWMEEVRTLRSRVLYGGGRRPRFGPGSAGEGDPDPLDLESMHIVVRDSGSLLGCVRITPINGVGPSATEQAIGRERWVELLRHMKVPREQIVEHGRWVVAPESREIGTGLYLMALSFALAYKLGYSSSVATASVDVVEMLEKAGARRAPSLASLHSEYYDGEAIVMCGHQREFPPFVLRQFERNGALLGLGRIYSDVISPR